MALSEERYEVLVRAVANWCNVQDTLKAMQRPGRAVLFATIPGTRRREPRSKKAPGLIEASFGITSAIYRRLNRRA